MKLTYDLNQKDSSLPPEQRGLFKQQGQVKDFEPKTLNSVNEKLFQDFEPRSKQQTSKNQIENDSFMTSESDQSRQDLDEENTP